MARVLLTGSSGFLGRAIAARLLAAGHDVLGLDPAPPAGAPRIHHLAEDLSSRARLCDIVAEHRISHVIHAGGISGPMVIPDDPARIMDINVTSSLNLLQASMAGNVGVFVYCSSVSAIGDFYEPQPIREDYPMRPTTPYGCSKAAVDMVLRGLWRRVALDLCSLRFTGIYGPGRRTAFVVDEIVAAGFDDRPARVAAATDRPFVYVDDAADAAVAACFSDRRQLAYYIAHPEQVSLADLADAVSAELGRPVALDIDPALPPERRGPVDIAPAARDFGFSPRIGFREGVRRMIEARRRA
jgi:nucleoside-diphosphate-sugar epimerase